MDTVFDYFGPVKTSHTGFCLSTLQILIEYLSGGSYLVMNSTPIFYGGITLLAIV